MKMSAAEKKVWAAVFAAVYAKENNFSGPAWQKAEIRQVSTQWAVTHANQAIAELRILGVPHLDGE